jgi:hypothetical protein
MREDLERVRRRQRERDAGAPGGAAAQPAGADFGGGDSARGAGGAGGGLKEAVDKLLIADFFFVIFALAWFTAGLAQQAGGQSTVRFLGG